MPSSPRRNLPAANSATPLVLLVDDGPDNLEIYAQYMRFAGLDIETASTAEDAIAIAKQRRPNVIVMDFALPGLDGIEATRRLKADPDTAGTKIIVLTGHTLAENEQAAFDAGADDYCTKPCLPDQLFERVRAFLPSATTGKRPKLTR